MELDGAGYMGRCESGQRWKMIIDIFYSVLLHFRRGVVSDWEFSTDSGAAPGIRFSSLLRRPFPPRTVTAEATIEHRIGSLSYHRLLVR